VSGQPLRKRTTHSCKQPPIKSRRSTGAAARVSNYMVTRWTDASGALYIQGDYCCEVTDLQVAPVP